MIDWFKNNFYWFLVIIWASLIFLLSSQNQLPALYISFFDFVFKKTAHVFVYAVLFLLVYKAMTQSFVKTKLFQQKKQFYVISLSFILCLLYACSDEIHQSFVNGRTASLRDIGYDSLGMLIVILKKIKYI